MLSTRVALLALFAAAGCTHFPHVLMTRSLETGETLTLSHSRVCAGDRDAIAVTYSPSGAVKWSLENENKELVREGTLQSAAPTPFMLEVNELKPGRYTFIVNTDESHALEASFEAFPCASR